MVAVKCTKCGRMTNTVFCNAYFEEPYGVATECYAAWVDGKWVEGCAKIKDVIVYRMLKEITDKQKAKERAMAKAKSNPKEKSQFDFDNLFVHHPPKGTQVERYQILRDAAREFAEHVDACCPDSADKTAAIRKIRESLMTANAAIAINE